MARRQISKYKAKDRKKAEKKQRLENKATEERKVSLVRQKQVDDFITQARSAKGKGYDKMKVDDFLSYDFAEDSDNDDKVDSIPVTTRHIQSAPIDIRMIPVKVGRTKVIQVALDDQLDGEDYMGFKEEEADDNGAAFFNDNLDDEDERLYVAVEVNNGTPAEEDQDDEYADEDLYPGDEEDLDDVLEADYFDLDEEDDNNNGDEYTEALHKKKLKALKLNDPEFYAYITSTAPDMFQYDLTTAINASGKVTTPHTQSASTGATTAKKATKSQQQHQSQSHAEARCIQTLTADHFIALKTKFDSRSYSAKDILTTMRVFRSAVIANKKAKYIQSRYHRQGGETLTPQQRKKINFNLLIITASPLFQNFLQFALRTIPLALMETLYLNNSIPLPYLQQATPNAPRQRDRDEAVSWRELAVALSDGLSPIQSRLSQLNTWPKVISTLARSYFLTTFTLLRDSVDTGLNRIILRAVLPVLPLLENTQIPSTLYLRPILHIWAYSVELPYVARSHVQKASVYTDNISRLEAFLVLRRLMVCLPFMGQIKESICKGVYHIFSKISNHTTSLSFPTIQFLTNCIVELYGIDGVVAYQLTFLYLRQLATQLRQHLVGAANNRGLRSVYNWQYINALRIWITVLSTYAIEPTSALRPLIYPLTQICTTVLSLSAAPSLFSAKIILCELLTELMYKAQVYLPITTHLLNALRHPLFSKKKHTNITKKHLSLQVEFTYKVHVPEGEILETVQYKENIGHRIIDALSRHLTVIADAIYFPEYSHPVRMTLKQLLTMVQIPSLQRDLRLLQTSVNETVHYVLERRGKVAFSPRDVITKQVNALTLMSNTIALNALHSGAGGSGTVGQPKISSIQRFSEKRLAARQEQDNTDIKLNKDSVGTIPGHNDDDDDDFDYGDDEEEEYMSELTSKSMKRKAMSNGDDDDDEDDEDDYDDEDDWEFYDEDDDVMDYDNDDDDSEYC